MRASITVRYARPGNSGRSWAAVVSLAITASFVLAAAPPNVDFNFQVRPLLSDRCFKCHGPDESARKAKLRLDTREGAIKELEDGRAVIKPRDPVKSELVRRIFAEDEDDKMPPPKSNLKLSLAEKELLKRWVAEGAEYKSHWAFIPVGQVTPPQPRDKQRVRNPIDAFVLSRLETEKLRPAPEASRDILIRRLALDLTGLPPTLEEIDSFLADKSPQAYENVVEEYLASPAYGERMAMDWLDLARYADTYGYQADVDYDMSPWRDWVIRAFNENLAYDKFLLWQIAGDLLPNATREQRLATAFNRLHRQTNEGGSIEEEWRTEYVADRVNTMGTAMLGLTLECARCHDHKYDAVTQRDYYSLFAFFNNIDESGLYSHFTRATPTPTLMLWPDDKSQEEASLSSRLAEAEEQRKQAEQHAQAAFRAWLKTNGVVGIPQPAVGFAFDTVVSNTTPDSVKATKFAKWVDGPKLVTVEAGILPAVELGFQPGGESAGSSRLASASGEVPGGQMPPSTAGGTPAATNFALQFSGDNELVCEGVGEFSRTDTFSFSLWLKPTEKQDRALILHRSRAWTDSGSRGYELVLDHGRPFFGLIHFWPGNAIGVRANQTLPTNEWSHVAVTYDGSSRAAGVRLYLNGARLETDTVRDNLYKDIAHRKEWGDSDVDNIHLTLAARFRDSGFKNGLIDDFQVFDVCLTEVEVKLIARGESGTNEPLTLTLSPGEREQQTPHSSPLSAPKLGQSPVIHQKRRAILPSHEPGVGSPRREEADAVDSRGLPPRYLGGYERGGRGEGKALFDYFLARHYEPYQTALAELKQLREQENDLFNEVREIMTMKELPQPRPTFLLKRGAYDAPGDRVQPDTPSSILAFPSDQPRNRLGLARWMIDHQNPLTARVVVNRIWRMHFSRGLVASQEDFGSQGKLPTHPELLDWLAGWFMDNGWDVKSLHRLIVTSATYRQSSQAPRELVERDPDNALLARGPKHRLLAEQIRDSALAASGLLNRTMGGPSVKPYQPAGLWEQSGTGKTYTQDKGDKLYRRSLYTFWRRTAPPPSMLTFDATTREVCSAKRETTATALQALVLMNDPQFVEAPRALGERLLKAHPEDLDARIREAFRLLTGRSPDEKEIFVLRQLFEEQKTFYAQASGAADKLLATGDSKWDGSLSRADFAAMTILVSAIMNFDEFVMQR
jgi:hypothetical protein